MSAPRESNPHDVPGSSGPSGRPEGQWQQWTEIAAEAMRELLQSAREPASDLASAVEQHLLLAQLAPRQAKSVRRNGWFELLWPEQALTLRVHTRSVPTVDAYQCPPQHAADTGRGAATSTHTTLAALIAAARDEWRAAAPAGALGAGDDADYLISWDIRHARGSGDGTLRFHRAGPSAVALARLVLEAYRRGALPALLNAAEPVRRWP